MHTISVICTSTVHRRYKKAVRSIKNLQKNTNCIYLAYVVNLLNKVVDLRWRWRISNQRWGSGDPAGSPQFTPCTREMMKECGAWRNYYEILLTAKEVIVDSWGALLSRHPTIWPRGVPCNGRTPKILYINKQMFYGNCSKSHRTLRTLSIQSSICDINKWLIVDFVSSKAWFSVQISKCTKKDTHFDLQNWTTSGYQVFALWVQNLNGQRIWAVQAGCEVQCTTLESAGYRLQTGTKQYRLRSSTWMEILISASFATNVP